ncbi:Flp family type IVb pilin [Photobacterium kagoshimensis]|uniref:Flp family type IVb pilin n=1 Tax=Photobacterium kagoshimensis TaxID=2910242 RepID=UPI003D09E468
MKNLLSQFWNNEDGITAIEYAMLGVAMAVGLTAILGGKDKDGTFLKSLNDAFGKIANTITSGGSATN